MCESKALGKGADVMIEWQDLSPWDSQVYSLFVDDMEDLDEDDSEDAFQSIDDWWISDLL